MIIRKNYLDKLISFKDNELVKIITGIRRSGKSTLLLMFKNYLIENGIKEHNIIYMNFESSDYDEITNYKHLNKFIKSKYKNEKIYILLDEIQLVEKWEKSINSFRVDYNCDIYITGSNAYLLSGEMATLLSGRYVSLKMYPLSFKEYLEFESPLVHDKLTVNNPTIKVDNESIIIKKSKEELFYEYLKFGGLPIIPEIKNNESLTMTYLIDVKDAIIKKDIISRNNIKDTALLENLIKFIASNIGNIVSPKSISDYLSNGGTNPTNETVDNYLKMFENAFIIHKVSRYDIKGKELLKTLGKYYIADSGIRNSLCGYSNIDEGHLLENIVYLELLRRGYDIYIGKNNEYEIDFIASNLSEKKYYQVTKSLMNENVLEREFRSLETILDNYEKIIITADRTITTDKEGIKFLNIIDFLLEE